MDTGARIEPYSPEWWHFRQRCYTASESWKLMSEPRGKSPKQRLEDHEVKLAALEAKYGLIAPSKLSQKSSLNLKERIEKGKEQYKALYEHRNDLHISDTAETYILQKVHETITNEVKQGIDNAATQWGIEYEPLARKWYAKITGNVLGESLLHFHKSIEGFSCTPDNPIIPEGLVEFKCPYAGENHLKNWLISSDEYMKEKHPDYYWQMTSQMNIMEQPFCDLVSFDPRINNDRGLFIFKLNYNEQDGQALEERVKTARSLYDQYLKLFAPELEPVTQH